MNEQERPNMRYEQLTTSLRHFHEQVERPYSKHKKLLTKDVFERIDASGKIQRPLSAEKKYALKALLGEPDILRQGHYLEIGPGAELRDLPRAFTAESPYIGVEGGRSNYRVASAVDMMLLEENEISMLNLELQVQKEHASIMFGDGKNLNFANASAQEVFFGNVLLSTGVTDYSIFEMLVEAERVLSPETGIVIIGESDLIPNLQPGTTHRPLFGKLGVILANAGFNERIFLDNHDDPTFQYVHSLLNWPIRPNEQFTTQFIIAKPSPPPLQTSWWHRITTPGSGLKYK